MTTPSYPGENPQNPQYQNPQYPNPQYQSPQYQNPQYPGAQGSPYPGGGYPGQVQYGQVTQPAAPGTVKGAFLIYLLAALLAALGIVLSLTSSVWDDAIAAAGNDSGVSTQTLVNTAKIVTVVVSAILLALYLLFAFKMRAGRNWARVVLTVLSALSIASSFSASASVTVNGNVYKSTSTQATGWIGAALGIIAIVLMFLPASNAYFSASKAARSQQLR